MRFMAATAIALSCGERLKNEGGNEVWSFVLDLDDTAWWVPLHQVGLDVVFIHSNASSSPSISRTAHQNELKLRLWNGEKKEYQRRGKTDKQTMRSAYRDDIIGEILDQNMGFIPFAVSPGGHPGGLGSALLYGNDLNHVPSSNDEMVLNVSMQR